MYVTVRHALHQYRISNETIRHVNRIYLLLYDAGATLVANIG